MTDNAVVNQADPYLRPNTSRSSKLQRLVWQVVYVLLFRPSLRPMHAWRGMLLRLFGAKLGPNPRIYPKVEIWAPWNLVGEDLVAVADGAIIYNPAPVFLGSHCVVSQEAYLCGASHDIRDPGFPMIWKPIRVEAYAWVCARSTVQMGVTVGEGAVLALGAVATRDLPPWTVHAGVPAKQVGVRPRNPPAEGA